MPPSYTCQDPLDFSWWFLMNIAPLYAYDEHGISQKKVSPLGVVAVVFVISVVTGHNLF